MNVHASLIIFLVLPSTVFAAAPNYQEHIAPIFLENCIDCHGSGKQRGGLDLSSFANTLKGGSGGVVVKAGLPDTSILFKAINHRDDVKAMPDEGEKLAVDDIKLIEEWIAGGLIDVPGGKSLLRDVSRFTSAKSNRPADPAFPEKLPEVPFEKVLRPLPIIALAVNPWSDVIAVNGYRQVILYGRKQPGSQFQHLGNLAFPEEEIHDLRFSADGECLIAAGGCGGDTGYVVIFDVRSGRRITRLANEEDVVLSADISADKKYVAIGTPKKLVKIYSVENGKLLHQISKHTDWVTSVRFSADGKLLATGDRNGSIYVWETESGGIAFTLAEHNMKVASLSWRSDGKLLASGGDDGKLILWDMNDGWPIRSTNAHNEQAESRYSRRTGVLSTMIDRSGNIYSGGRDQKLSIWKPDGTKAKTFSLDYLPTAIAGNHEGDNLVSGNERGELNIVNRVSGEVSQTIIPMNR